jgi:hypothetical protein
VKKEKEMAGFSPLRYQLRVGKGKEKAKGMRWNPISEHKKSTCTAVVNRALLIAKSAYADPLTDNGRFCFGLPATSSRRAIALGILSLKF